MCVFEWPAVAGPAATWTKKSKSLSISINLSQSADLPLGGL
jgi:hypothetical protein